MYGINCVRSNALNTVVYSTCSELHCKQKNDLQDILQENAFLKYIVLIMKCMSTF